MINLIYSFITFIIALFFIVLGAFAILLPWSEAIRNTMVTFLLENFWPLTLVGIAFIIIGIALASNIWFTSRRRYHKIRSGQNETFISDAILYDYLRSYWRTLYPAQEIPCRLALKKNKTQIFADLPYLPKEEQKQILAKIESEILEIFRDTLGYQKTLELSISFANRTSAPKPVPASK